MFLSFFAKGQVNLVPNPSFEIYSSCPDNNSQIKKAIGWDTLKAGGGGTPDFYHACDPLNAFSTPYQIFSFQNTKSGLGYSDLVLYASQIANVREYMQSKLIHKLQNNKSYCVTAFVNLTNYSTCGIDKIGFYFDNGSVYAPWGTVTSNSIIPQVENSTGVITDTLNWIKIQGTFVANGTEEYISIGNFRYDTQINIISTSTNIAQHATYYFDDISVIEAETKAYAGQDKLICLGDSIFIGRTPEIGLECSWFNNNTQIAEGAGIWVKPDTIQHYVVKQDVCGLISYDTVKISIKDDVLCYLNTGSNTLEIPNTFTPNNDGINDTFYISLGINNYLNRFEVYNRWGNLIHQTIQTNKQSNNVLWDGRTTSGEPCSDGVYFYVLKYTDASGTDQNLKGHINLFR